MRQELLAIWILFAIDILSLELSYLSGEWGVSLIIIPISLFLFAHLLKDIKERDKDED